MSDYRPNDSVRELSETQKLGRSMKWFGISRLALIGSIFLITMMASFATSSSLDINSPNYMEEATSALMEYMSQPWTIIFVYVFQALVIAGLGFMIFSLNVINKNSPGDQTFERVYYLFLASFGVSIVLFLLSLILDFLLDSQILAWIAMILNLAIPGFAIAGYYVIKPWCVSYEQQMGAAFPILSSRIRRVFLGEILVFSGMVFNIFSILISLISGTSSLGGGSFLGVFTIVGEILVGSNLIRSGKLLELETFPQQPYGFPSGQPPQQPQRPQQAYADLEQFRQPQKLIPDKAYFCPSCGSQLESESYDFCMKCGKAIPKPKKGSLSLETVEEETETFSWKCKFCGTKNSGDSSICENCGVKGRPD